MTPQNAPQGTRRRDSAFAKQIDGCWIGTHVRLEEMAEITVNG
jgi:hypothetical protein